MSNFKGGWPGKRDADLPAKPDTSQDSLIARQLAADPSGPSTSLDSLIAQQVYHEELHSLQEREGE